MLFKREMCQAGSSAERAELSARAASEIDNILITSLPLPVGLSSAPSCERT